MSSHYLPDAVTSPVVNINNYEASHITAERLGVTDRRVRQMCTSGQLKCVKIGRDWLIKKGAMPTQNTRGRPPTWAK